MKLARKLAIAFVLGVFLVVALHAYVRVRREISLFENDIGHDAQLYGRVLATAVAEISRAHDRERALAIVSSADKSNSNVRIRWVELDAPEQSPLAPSAPRVSLEPLEKQQEVVVKLPRLGESDEEHLVTYVPVIDDGKFLGAIELAESLVSEKQYIRTSVRNTLIATLATTIVCGILAVTVGMWLVGRPIRTLVEQARRIGAGDFTTRIRLAQKDEISDLAEEMNAMSEKLELAHSRVAAETAGRISAIEQLRHADRLATVGKLGAGIAHELGAPLQVISGRARMLLEPDVTAEEVQQNSRIVIEQTDRITRIVRQLLDFARQRSAEKSRNDLQLVVRQPASLLRSLAHKRSIEIYVETSDGPVWVDVDAEQIQQVLTNLLVNGIQAMDHGGKLIVSLRTERIVPPSDVGGPEATYACIEVKDEGKGMPPEIAAHVFEPFFTTKDVGEGTGLGLSVAYGIVREHGGFITLESAEGKGSTFRIHLPWSGPT